MNETVETSPVTLVDLIDRLVPAPEPPAVSMMPQTWGWAAPALLLVIALAYATWRWRRRYVANAYRRDALAALRAAGSDPVAIAGILRRCALAAFPRMDVASLSGPDWLAFLDHTGGGTAFREGEGQVISLAPYTGQSPDAPDLTRIAEHWIRSHRPEGVT
ncbi:DUF4381 domain-containing protein [Ruegeria sp.]|uniref:DUF4381 domain-containing protein n=1 Tax=Ruegeria sp. TaxID=1879320 RepID=UPI00231A0D6F|nr:DUF4381 domain-containing protein [Ruegeria sp.]MDA7963979.1 DUF4381 domain-containing protein [Ruegeria sp.]